MKRFIRPFGVLFLMAATLLAQGLLAQSGAVSGHVTDSSGSILQGAQVELQPTAITVITDAQGAYYINNLSPGTYTITITYVGFALFTKPLEIVAGKTVTVDAKMAVSSQKDEVLVTAERASGEAEDINRQRTADNVLQVLTNEVITSLPNANMADALGRLPSVTLERDEGEGKYVQIRGTEPRLTNATIDGVNVPSPESGVRQIKFDTLPADLVESVEINKTLQANMDGDGIGGSVNMVTKTAGERPTVSFTGIGGYTPIIGGRGVVESAGTLGQRFGAEKRLGVLIGGTYDWNGRGIDDIEPVSDLATLPNGTQQLWKDAQDIREYKYYRSRWGVGGSADYKLSDASDIYIRGLYSDFKNFGSRWVYSLTDNTPGVQLLGPGIGVNNGCQLDALGFTTPPCTGVPSFNTSIRRPDYAIGSVVAGGKHVFNTTWYSWDVSASRSRQIENGDPQANFASTLSSSSCQFDPAATVTIYRPQWNSQCFTEAYDPTTMQFNQLTYSHGHTAQLNLQGTAAMAKRYHAGPYLSTIEIGGKFRNAHKFDDSINYTITPLDSVGAVPLANFPNTFTNNNYYNKSYNLGYNPSYNDVYAYTLANSTHFVSPNDPSAQDLSSQFDLIEQVASGYVMNTIDIGKARIIAGIRFEGTNLRTTSFDANTNLVDVKNSGSYLNVLPSAAIRYALDSNTFLRLAYARGLSRPDPQDIAQGVSWTFVGPNDPKNSATISNPALKAETADNFDLLVEHYLNPFGVITAGFFYKNLYNPIAQETFPKANFSPAPNAPVGTYQVTQFINAGSAWLYGFEVAYVQHMTFLPGLLRGFGLGANYGYANSRAIGLPGRSDDPRLLRSAPNTWNISPTYDLGRFSFRAGLSYNADNIYSYSYQDGTGGSTPTPGGVKGPFGDIYFYPHLQIDMQGSIRLAKGFTFIGYILNVNNEVFGFYQGSSQYMIQREYYQPTYAAGLRWSPRHEK
jgi:TonB-dependent receptor